VKAAPSCLTLFFHGCEKRFFMPMFGAAGQGIDAGALQAKAVPSRQGVGC